MIPKVIQLQEEEAHSLGNTIVEYSSPELIEVGKDKEPKQSAFAQGILSIFNSIGGDASDEENNLLRRRKSEKHNKNQLLKEFGPYQRKLGLKKLGSIKKMLQKLRNNEPKIQQNRYQLYKACLIGIEELRAKNQDELNDLEKNIAESNTDTDLFIKKHIIQQIYAAKREIVRPFGLANQHLKYLVANIRDPDNESLRRRLVNMSLRADKIFRMREEEFYSEERKKRIKEIQNDVLRDAVKIIQEPIEEYKKIQEIQYTSYSDLPKNTSNGQAPDVKTVGEDLQKYLSNSILETMKKRITDNLSGDTQTKTSKNFEQLFG